jgi:VanZ family protein
MPILVSLYVILVIGLQMIPLGGDSLNAWSVGFLRVDYLLHTVLFMPWMGFLCFRVGRSSGWRLEKVDVGFRQGLMWMALGFGLAVGAEVLQHWAPQRTFNPVDMFFNSLGLVAGGVLVLLSFRRPGWLK